MIYGIKSNSIHNNGCNNGRYLFLGAQAEIMERHEYKSYSKYTKVQRAGYDKKKSRIWANQNNIKFICDNILRDKYFIIDNGQGICHGVRTGKEIEWFLEYMPGWEVIGTEIGDSENDLIFQWDFNKENPKWINGFDFIYSNAFDHVYDPKITLEIWSEQLKPGGIMIIEHSSGHEKATELDPFGATAEDMEIMLAMYAKLKHIKKYTMPEKTSKKYKYQYAIMGIK